MKTYETKEQELRSIRFQTGKLLQEKTMLSQSLIYNKTNVLLMKHQAGITLALSVVELNHKFPLIAKLDRAISTDEHALSKVELALILLAKRRKHLLGTEDV